ncbi:MAG: hypothetical protein Kow0081_0390 [Candidatus Dojkabacteria bacterium]
MDRSYEKPSYPDLELATLFKIIAMAHEASNSDPLRLIFSLADLASSQPALEKIIADLSEEELQDPNILETLSKKINLDPTLRALLNLKMLQIPLDEYAEGVYDEYNYIEFVGKSFLFSCIDFCKLLDNPNLPVMYVLHLNIGAAGELIDRSSKSHKEIRDLMIQMLHNIKKDLWDFLPFFEMAAADSQNKIEGESGIIVLPPTNKLMLNFIKKYLGPAIIKTKVIEISNNLTEPTGEYTDPNNETTKVEICFLSASELLKLIKNSLLNTLEERLAEIKQK